MKDFKTVDDYLDDGLDMIRKVLSVFISAVTLIKGVFSVSFKFVKPYLDRNPSLKQFLSLFPILVAWILLVAIGVNILGLKSWRPFNDSWFYPGTRSYWYLFLVPWIIAILAPMTFLVRKLVHAQPMFFLKWLPRLVVGLLFFGILGGISSFMAVVIDWWIHNYDYRYAGSWPFSLYTRICHVLFSYYLGLCLWSCMKLRVDEERVDYLIKVGDESRRIEEGS